MRCGSLSPEIGCAKEGSRCAWPARQNTNAPPSVRRSLENTSIREERRRGARLFTWSEIIGREGG